MRGSPEVIEQLNDTLKGELAVRPTNISYTSPCVRSGAIWGCIKRSMTSPLKK